MSTETVNQQHVNEMTLHCGKCNTVLSDSFGICGEALASVVCFRVSRDVIIGDELEKHKAGETVDECVYSALHCSGCDCPVGKVLHSAPQHLASLRSLFLLQKENMYCYIFSRASMVMASKFNFDLSPIVKSISEQKQTLEAQLEHLSRQREG